MRTLNISKYFIGIDDQTKRCSKCLKDLLLSNFSNGSGGNYLRSECKACTKKHSKIVNKIKKNLIPPPADYKCPICNKTEDVVKGRGGKNSGAWCCDHDHTTHTFRGWLCHQCNRSIGGMNDNIDQLKAAIEYLERHKENKMS